VEEQYQRGHRPLWEDLKNAEQHLGRLWSWARKAASRWAARYAGRVEDESLIERVEVQSTLDS
jgi:hypothetical protein